MPYEFELERVIKEGHGYVKSVDNKIIPTIHVGINRTIDKIKEMGT